MAAPILSTRAERGWLDERSPLHKEFDWLWEQNERRFEGGHQVWDELWRFDWESSGFGRGIAGEILGRDIKPLSPRQAQAKTVWLDFAPLAPGEHYQRRQESSVYVNFMEALATDTVGHLFKQAPAPDAGLDFGTLGLVRRKEDIDVPTEAEQVYYNIDGVGIDGSQWDSFWSTQLKLAMATGYRWIFVEAPTEAPRTKGQVRRGLRPWAVSFSPRSVINHHYEQGALQFAIIKVASRRPRLVKGSFTGNDPAFEYLFLVRQDFTGFDDNDDGILYSAGGWWKFDSERMPIAGANGNWAKTEGQIPLVPLFYDRHPTMFGRPALTELGNAGIAAMNLHSCADFDAFDSAGSVKALAGVDRVGFNLFIEKVLGGNRYAPLPTNEETQKVPSVADATGGVVVADVFEKRLEAIARAVDRIRGTEVNSAPQASGLAQQAGFTMGSVPRLSLVASNLETAQNAVINLFEERFGHAAPSGSIRWTRKFELITLTSSAQAILQLQAIAGVDSEELTTRVIVAAAQDEAFVPDNQAKTKIDSELRTSYKTKIKNANALAKAKTAPQVPGARARNMPPEPAGTNQPIKPQLDGPNIP